MKSWLVNLKKGDGSVTVVDKKTKADCIMMISDDNLVKLFNGKLDGQNAFMQGKLKIKGNMMLATKLSNIIKPKASM